MNKKFFTLTASLLLTSAFSAYATAEYVSLADSKKGQFVEIKFGSSANKLLQIKDNNELETATFTAVTDADKLAAAFDQQWQIASLKYDTNSGTPIYQFVNKGTGQYLAINLKTDNKGASNNVAKINAAGNKDWCYDATSKHLYVFQNDSTYTLDNNLKLIAAKGNAVPAGAAEITIQQHDKNDAVTLNAKVLNGLMGKAGKLYFNDQNVTSGEKNIIADNVWKAYADATANQFFLARFSADSVTSVNKNPYVLMVDTAVYAGSTLHTFCIDTLAITKAAAATMKDPTTAFALGTYNSEKPLEYAHQVKAATWKGTYTFGNDSIALNVLAVPTKEKQQSIVTDGKKQYGGAVDEMTGTISFGWDALSADLNANFAQTSINTGADAVRKAMAQWHTNVVAADASSLTDGKALKLSESTFTTSGTFSGETGSVTFEELIATAEEGIKNAPQGTDATKLASDTKLVAEAKKFVDLQRTQSYNAGEYYHVEYAPHQAATTSPVESKVVLAQLSNTKVLTLDNATSGTLKRPLIQAVSTKGGDAVIDGNGKVYFMQVAKEPAEGSDLRAATLKGKYLVDSDGDVFNEELVDDVDAANVYAQWGFIEGATGYYQIVNRGTGAIASWPINKTSKSGVYEIAGEEFRLIEVDLSNADIREEKGVKYDYTGYYYGGPADGVSQSFQITPASALLSNVAVQFDKDSVLVLGKSENAPVWYLEGGDKTKTYGAEIPGLPQLKKVEAYKIYTTDKDGKKYYVYVKNENPKVYRITKEDSENAASASKFDFRTQAANAYLFLDANYKATINLNLTVPTIEASDKNNERNDYFSFSKSEYSDYRTLVAEDGLLGNAKIFMENEPNRFLYENTQNIVANNGNKIAKDSLNFLGIYNADASVHNAALYVDTAFVDRKDNTRPQYLLAVGVTEVAATEGHACTESGKHFDADGKETTADKCVHATPGTKGYKTGRYLVSVKDSVPAIGFTKHPSVYDGKIRLAFVEAKHIADTLEIANSKFTAEEHVNDSITINKDLNVATFALKIVDQATKSFVLETKGAYVRILNGVPVLDDNFVDAAVFNIEATTEEATANEAIEASQVTVIGGQGVVTVQGAAGKVITVANILGQTIANQVAASDNVTIAAPAGVVVVAVDGEATKVVVK